MLAISAIELLLLEIGNCGQICTRPRQDINLFWGDSPDNWQRINKTGEPSGPPVLWIL